MTIVHLTTSLAAGGAEEMVFQLARLSHPEIKTIVISVSGDNAIGYKFEELEIPIHFLNINSFRNHTLMHGLRLMHTLLKHEQNMVFHGHQFHGCALAMLYNFKHGKHPIVFTLHSNKLESLSKRLLLGLTKQLRKRDIIFSKNSNKWYLKKGTIIPNGINFEEFARQTPIEYDNKSSFRFLFLGRLDVPKNPQFLVQSALYLKEKTELPFKIVIVGDGHLMQPLINDIKLNSLENYFEIKGYQRQVVNFIKNAHCLVLPSLWEGMPMSIIESAGMKLPIIATPVGSIPDFLNTKNAYVATLTNFNSEMLHVMNKYSEALTKADILYDEIRSKYDIKNVFKTHLNLYKQLTKLA